MLVGIQRICSVCGKPISYRKVNAVPDWFYVEAHVWRDKKKDYIKQYYIVCRHCMLNGLTPRKEYHDEGNA